jgi:hypothetical protein
MFCPVMMLMMQIVAKSLTTIATMRAERRAVVSL